MWLLVYMFIMNSAVNQRTFQNKYRFSLGVAEVGVVEISIILVLFYSLFTAANRFSRYPGNRVHPAMVACLCLLFGGFFCGMAGSVVSGASLGNILRNAREFVALPICIVIGYCCLANPKAAWIAVWSIVVGGIITATLLYVAFVSGADSVATQNNWQVIRQGGYQNVFAGMTAYLLLYGTVNARVRLVALPLAFIMGAYALVAYFSPMHRSDWVSITGAFLAGFFLLPPQQRLSTFSRMLIIGPLAGVALYVGVQIGSKVTGRDFAATVTKRIESLLPTERKGNEAKAWDTRVGSIGQELSIWLSNPLFGGGFAIQATEVEKGDLNDTKGYFHNGWASVLATTGVFGFAGIIAFITSLGVIGFRLLRTAPDRGSIAIGLLAYGCCFYLILEAATTMIWGTRSAMFFGILGGMMFRCRDFQQTTMMLAAEEAYSSDTEYEELDPLNLEGRPTDPHGFY